MYWVLMYRVSMYWVSMYWVLMTDVPPCSKAHALVHQILCFCLLTLSRGLWLWHLEWERKIFKVRSVTHCLPWPLVKVTAQTQFCRT